MGRHDREDHDRHHRSGRHSEEKYSLHELKDKARREVHHSGNHRNEDYHQRSRNDHDSRYRRNQSRSGSPRRYQNKPERRRSFSRSPIRSRHSPNNKFNQNDRPQRPGRNHDKDFQRNRDNNHGRSEMNTGAGPSTENAAQPEEKPAEIKPNFELTGNLSKDTNMFNGVLVKYNEPAEAKKPRKHWRFYPFKGDTPLDFIPLHRQSAYMFGRDRRVVDVPIDHPSCSKQHAVLQFRSIQIEREDGSKVRATRPYIIDLESGNGTFVNNKQIEAKRYVELLESDVVKFGFSTREYVLLHEQSQGEKLEESDIETL